MRVYRERADVKGRLDRSSAYLGHGEVRLREGATDIEKWHEIGHKDLDHNAESRTVTGKELIGNEIDAEIYAWKHVEKALTPMVGRVAMEELVVVFGVLPLDALRMVAVELKRKGFQLSTQDGIDLITDIK